MGKEQQKGHSSNLESKLKIRKAALAQADKGALFVPFCGFGECPTGAEYPMDRVWACDVDKDAVGHWHATWPDATTVLCKGEKFRAWPKDQLITFIDVDAYSSPWKVLEHALLNGPCAKRIQIVATETDKGIERTKRSYNFQSHMFEQVSSLGAKEQRENMERHVTEWLEGLGFVVVLHERIRSRSQSGAMGYWWLTLEGVHHKRTPPKEKEAPKKRRQLTPKQALFVLEYLVDFNATQAAIRAGYSKKTAGSQGQRLLKNVEIARQIEKVQAGRADRLEITVDRVALEMARLAFASIAEVADFGAEGIRLKESTDLSDDTLASISEIIEGKEGDLRVKMHAKAQALELLGKHLGMFKENINITGGQDSELLVTFVETGKDLDADDSGEEEAEDD